MNNPSSSGSSSSGSSSNPGPKLPRAASKNTKAPILGVALGFGAVLILVVIGVRFWPSDSTDEAAPGGDVALTAPPDNTAPQDDTAPAAAQDNLADYESAPLNASRRTSAPADVEPLEPNDTEAPAFSVVNRDAENTPAVSATGKRMPRTALELVKHRQELDQTVWSKEVEAQRYEQTFVNLWDSLLQQTDKYAVFEQFPFESLVIGTTPEKKQVDWGVEITTFLAPTRSIDAAEWPALLAKFESDGYEIVETEWHHSSFDYDAAGEAHSSVSILIHVANPRLEQRFILKGVIDVAWATEPGAGGAAKPRSIDATDVKVIHREGPPAFAEQEMWQFPTDGTGQKHPSTIHPLMLYDLDEDGLPEIIMGGYNRVYWNRGDWRFEEATLCDVPPGHVNAAIFADFDGDGVTDYFCAPKNGFPKLYKGAPGGKFSQPPSEFRLFDEMMRSPTALAAGDIDGDGDQDVYIGQQKPGYASGDIPTPYYDANDSYPAYLLLNDGQGGFTEATEQSGLAPKRHRRMFSASFVDLDGDQDLDLLTTSDFCGTDMFYNDGQGRFTDVTETLEPRCAAFGMSHSFGDYDLDGHLDFIAIGMSSTTARRLEQMNLGREDFPDYNRERMNMGYGNRMFLGGGSHFKQAAFNDTVARTGWSWGSTTLDFDNDGDPDIYIVNGQTSGKTTKDYCTRFWCHDVYYKRGERPDAAIRELFSRMAPLFQGEMISWNGYEHNALLMNLDGQEFLNVGFLMGASFEFDSRAAVSGDLDGDGRVDLVVEQKDVRNRLANVYLVKNQARLGGHWVGLHLRPAAGGSTLLGAKVVLRTADGVERIAHNLAGHSVWAQHPDTVHFGLGDQAGPASLEVQWPNGAVSRLADVPADAYQVLAAPEPEK